MLGVLVSICCFPDPVQFECIAQARKSNYALQLIEITESNQDPSILPEISQG